MPDDDRQVRTERLRLDAVTDADLEPMYALHSDAEVWRHLPSGRHLDRAKTSALISEIQQAWERDGLGYWAARVLAGIAAEPHGVAASTPDALPMGAFVGVGGCARRFDLVWNVYYRLTPAAWGRGLAGEIVSAARTAAARVDPRLPVVAYLLEHNGASKRTAERAGLSLARSGPDTGNSDPAAVRLLYSDRPLTDDVASFLMSHA